MKKLILTSIVVLACYFMQESHAQISFVVAKEGSSSIAYLVTHGGTSTNARKQLKAKYPNNSASSQGCDTECGHKLTSGYYVIVKCLRKDYNGNPRTSYGLGASSTNWAEAEERAVKNLAMYDWNWSRKKHGYQVEIKKEF